MTLFYVYIAWACQISTWTNFVLRNFSMISDGPSLNHRWPGMGAMELPWPSIAPGIAMTIDGPPGNAMTIGELHWSLSTGVQDTTIPNSFCHQRQWTKMNPGELLTEKSKVTLEQRIDFSPSLADLVIIKFQNEMRETKKIYTLTFSQIFSNPQIFFKTTTKIGVKKV